MDRNKRILKINEKTINFYDYYITNSCIIKFIDIDMKRDKKFLWRYSYNKDARN